MSSNAKSSNRKNSYTTLFDSQSTYGHASLPQEYSRDVIANVFVKKLGRYVYLSGRIVRTSENPNWGKVAHIYFTPLGKTIAVKWNNVITEGAFVEIKYAGEFYPVYINQIDSIRMEVTDEWNMSTWVNVTNIVQVLSHRDLAQAWYQIYYVNMETVS